ncbi:MAG: uncharacterized DUF497 family protein [Planctomycetota bacterium]|jgi:uncharacterized DUF497 family protein
MELDLNKLEGFQWDNGNRWKNTQKHDVTNQESEEVFFNDPLLVSSDLKHSQNEDRLLALGTTHQGRFLFVSFTIRNNFIRIISARDMHRKERDHYEKA